ncbi:MAG: hypothetical protein PHW83_11660 [Bacteroidales bacterium]|nr:hypothetical protein [Bacteroidales bacterium]
MFLLIFPYLGFSQYWDTNGNTVAAGKNKLGTINDFELTFITNNIERMRLSNTGYFGINTTSPTSYLDVNGQVRFRYGAMNYGVLISDANGNATWNLLNLDLTGNTLSIQNQGNTVDLSSYIDNTDHQTLSLVGTELSILNGNSVDFTNWDTDITDDFSGNYNDLTNLPTLFDGNWSNLQGTAPAISTFNNDVGYITNADDDDADPTNEIQDLQFDGNILTITQNGAATPIDLSIYDNNTDNQTLSLVGTELSILNGNSVDFTNWDTDITDDFSGDYNDLTSLPTLFDGNWSNLQGTAPAISTFNNDVGYITNADDADADPTNEIQDLQLDGNILTITQNGAATPIDLSIYDNNTDNQTLSLVGTELSILNGNSVDFTNWDTDITDDFSGDYNDLTSLPTLFDGNYNSLTNLPTLFDGNYSSLLGIPDFAQVAHTGDYNDLINLPDLFDGNYSSLIGAPTIESLNYWTKLNNNLYYNIGKVGIGISDPQKQLHIHNPNYSMIPADEVSSEQPTTRGNRFTSESSFLLTNKNCGSTATDGLIIRSYNNNAVIYLQEAGSLSLITKKALRFKMESNGNVAIGTLQNNFFVVKETGNVGIKTTDPTATFDINGDIRIRQSAAENYILTSDNTGTGEWKELKLELDGNTLSLVNHNSSVDLSSFRQSLSLVDQSLQLSNGGGSVALNNINYWTKSGNLLYYNSGNVGIGTNNPQAALHVTGNKLLVEENGNRLYLDADNGGVEIGSSTNQVTFWYAGNYSKIKTGDIISYGKVGIGTTSPSCKLDVDGIAKFGDQSNYIRVGKLGSMLNIDSYGTDLNINRNSGKGVYFGGELQVGDRMKVNQSGKIWAQEIKVALNDPYPDYVFKPDYDLMDIEELESFIKTNGHLPDVPNEESVTSNFGYDLGTFCLTLLEKIEELTLYTIEQEKRIKELENNLQFNSNK